MASKSSYSITIDNNITEKEGLSFLISSDINFLNPDKVSRKIIMELLSIDKKYSLAFDLIMIPGHTNLEEVIETYNYIKEDEN